MEMLSFCKPVSSKKRFSPFRPIDDEFSFTLFEKADEVNASDWDMVTLRRAPFLDRRYLRIVEDCGHARLTCRYVIVYRERTPVGVIYFQVIDFRAGVFGAMLRREVEEIRSTRRSLFERYIDANKDEILMRLFTCGNNLVSGEHGFLFSPEIADEQAHEIVLRVTDVIAREERLRNTISAILLKDFYAPLRPSGSETIAGMNPFAVEPNMVVHVTQETGSLEDYVSKFSKKYRKRARDIRQAGGALEKRNLSPEDLLAYERRVHELYAAVFSQARFKLLKLPVDYFSRVKKIFGDSFSVNGFFHNGELVSYCSGFVMPDETYEAHYVGFDYAMNAEFELYQNLLYTLIGEGISNGCRRINLGRTAAEIKSTVGARPVDLLCYIKPQNAISKLVQKPFISYLQPGSWTPRNPFRD